MQSPPNSTLRRFGWPTGTFHIYIIPTCFNSLPAMLRIPSASCHAVRHSRLCSGPNVCSTARPALCGRSRMHHAAPRNLTSSSVEPVSIASNRQEITFRLKDGGSVTKKISPTPKAKLDKLASALASLLSIPSSNSPARTHGPSFGTLHWELDPQGDAIHRHVALSSSDECDKVVQRIMAEAEEMNHHPHIAREDGGASFTVTCTTHSPRGLSVRDTRLAKKVDELLAGLDVTQPARLSNPSHDLEQLREQIVEQRNRTIAINRQKIADALEDCGCSTAKAV